MSKHLFGIICTHHGTAANNRGETEGNTTTLQKILWQGDVRILPALVKLVEDRINVVHDTGELGVQAILVIEDNIRFYSSFLPVIYAELMKQGKTAQQAHDQAWEMVREKYILLPPES